MCCCLGLKYVLLFGAEVCAAVWNEVIGSTMMRRPAFWFRAVIKQRQRNHCQRS